METNTQPQSLNRVISLPQLVFYGLGTMIGGGIYALTGKVAGLAGMHAPLSFVLSAALALLSALSYAELSTRYPLSAGAVQYVRAAFDRRPLSIMIGWLLIFTGIVSAAALSNATAGFIDDFTGLPQPLVAATLILLLGAIAAWGISESVMVVVVITLLEIAGLLAVVATSGDAFGQIGERLPELIPPALDNESIWAGIFGGTFLAFYAFIGFEDLVNVSEEVKDAERTMPLTIIICMAATMALYLLVVLAAILTVPVNELAESNTPLATIVERGGSGLPPQVLAVISMLATINGALVQIVMGSRVLYGMARAGEAPALFGEVNADRKTPVKATLVIAALTLGLALLFNLALLAKIASAIILVIFIAVNAALLKVKLAGESTGAVRGFRVPMVIPLLGLISSAALLVHELSKYLP